MSTAATRVLIRAAEACAARPEPHEVAALIEALVDRVLEHRAETYPPQVRASVSPAIGNSACVSPDADGERQPPAAITHADGSPLRAHRLPPEVPVAEVPLTRDVRERWESGPPRGSCACPEGYENGGCVFQAPVCPRKGACTTQAPSGAGQRHVCDAHTLPRRTIEHHSDTGRLGQAQDDFARRPRTVLLDGRGDAAPRNPAHDEGDLA